MIIKLTHIKCIKN